MSLGSKNHLARKIKTSGKLLKKTILARLALVGPSMQRLATAATAATQPPQQPQQQHQQQQHQQHQQHQQRNSN